MQIVALVSRLDHVCTRYRIKAFRDHLREAGHELTIQTLPRFWLSRWSLGEDACRADAVIVQRRLLTPWQLGLLRRHARRLIFDFDDAVFLRDSYDPRGVESARLQAGFTAMVRACDAVVAGNEWLAEQASLWTSPGRVHVIPTCVDVNRYPVAAHEPENPHVRLAWIGSSSTLQGIERIASILEKLGDAHPRLRLQLICDRSLDLKTLPVDFCAWSEATETRDLAAADIGISWLPDDSWSRGKCGLKVLQYMAAGLPVVANPVGVQAEMVEPDVTGFWAETPDEWLEAVGRLVQDTTLRRRLARAARRRVENEYDVTCGAERWVNLLESLHAPSRRELQEAR